MNLYKIEQNINEEYNSTYGSAVVCADSEENARLIHPSEHAERYWYDLNEYEWQDWALPKDIKVTLLGVAEENIEPGVICAFFNAG